LLTERSNLGSNSGGIHFVAWFSSLWRADSVR